MSTAMLNRLDRLEQRLLPSPNESITIWVRFDHPDEVGAELNVRSAQSDGRTFVRTTDESLSVFRDRIDAETRSLASAGSVRVVILHGAEDEPETPMQCGRTVPLESVPNPPQPVHRQPRLPQ